MAPKAGKHVRKKQKLAEEVQPLGSTLHLDGEAERDDEERRLESILFGKNFLPREDVDQDNILIASDGEGDNGLEQLDDSDLFVIDGQTAANPESQESSRRGGTTSIGPRKAVWMDPDDAQLRVSLAGTARLRKLRDKPTEDEVGGVQYEARLRREFERINPAPAWATDARKKVRSERKRRRDIAADGGDAADDEMDQDSVEDVEELLTRTDGILSRQKSAWLEKGVIGIERLRDANQSATAEGEIKSLSFYPSPRVPVLMAASTDRRVRFFNVDGHLNPHLQTMHIPELPVTNAIFHPSGSSVLLTGPRPYYYTIDLGSWAATRSPRGLWGTNPAQSGAKAADMSMERCAFSPSGSMLAVAGRRGYVQLIDWRSGGAQVVGSVKMHAGVQALWWNRHPSADGLELMTLSSDTEVYVWDVGERRCVKRWKEEGGYGATVMSGDSTGKYLCTGSKSGLVNVYDGDASSSSSLSMPKTQKVLKNLTTSISLLNFNHDSQLLAITSNAKKDQLRLVHLPSLTVYANWPTTSTPLGRVSAVDFSPNSEYLAIGNTRGRALLYHIPHFLDRY